MPFFRFLFILSMLFFLSACQLLQPLSYSNSSVRQERKNFSPSLVISSNIHLGLAYLEHGNRPKAKQKLLKALKLAPNCPSTLAALAYYYEQVDDLQAAELHYQKALSLSTDLGPQSNNYGAFLCRQGKYYEAEYYFLKAINDPNYLNTAGAYENAGLCLSAVPDYKKARYYFEKALSHDPNKSSTLYELVRMELKQKHSLEAIKHLQENKELVLNNLPLLDLAIEAANQVGNTKQAIVYKKHRWSLAKDNYSKLS